MAQPLESSSKSPSADTRHALVSRYDSISAEYYDAGRHPTCANFREVSGSLLSKWLVSMRLEGQVFCEVGAGKSLLAEILATRLKRLDNVFLLDASRSMLEYSTEWIELGAHHIVADASEIPLPDASVDVVVSSLGDPYNHERFWSEVKRILRPLGRMIFTTPSYEWARSFRVREQTALNVAEFVLSDGRRVYVPSYVLPVNRQLGLLRAHDFAANEVVDVPISDVKRTPVSPKLLCDRGPEASMVTGYFLTANDGLNQQQSVVGIVGHIGSGKTSIARFLETQNFQRIALSDLILKEATRLNVVSSRGALQDIGNALRREYGGSVLVDRALVSYLSKSRQGGLVIDGLRNPEEVMAVRRAGGFILGVIRKPSGQSADEATRSALRRESDPMEPAWGQRVADALRLTDKVVANNGSLADVFADVARSLSADLRSILVPRSEH